MNKNCFRFSIKTINTDQFNIKPPLKETIKPEKRRALSQEEMRPIENMKNSNVILGTKVKILTKQE